MGSAHPVAAPYQAFRTQDGWINIGAIGPANWARLANVLDLPSLLVDERFIDNGSRMANLPELVEIIELALQRATTDEWVEACEKAGVPAGPVRSMAQVLEDPHTIARKMVIEVEHPIAGTVKALGCPIKFSKEDGVTSKGSPLFGEHTVEVLREVGLSADEIFQLAKDGVIRSPQTSL